MSGMLNVQSFMQEMANKSKQAEEESLGTKTEQEKDDSNNNSKELSSQKDTETIAAESKVVENVSQVSQKENLEESIKSTEVVENTTINQEDLMFPEEILVSNKEEKDTSSQDNQVEKAIEESKNASSTTQKINPEDLPFPEDFFEERKTKTEEKKENLDRQLENPVEKVENLNKKEATEQSKEVQSNTQDYSTEKSKKSISRRKLDRSSDDADKTSSNSAHSKGKIKINRSKSIEKKDLDDPTSESSFIPNIVGENTNTTSKNKTLENEVHPENENPNEKVKAKVEKTIQKTSQESNGVKLNAAGRPIRVIRKDYPKFSRTKELYTKEDLENPNLKPDEREFILNRLKEQEILASVDQKISQQNQNNHNDNNNNSNNKSFDNKEEKHTSEVSDVVKNTPRKETIHNQAVVESTQVAKEASKGTQADTKAPTLEDLATDEYEVVERCDISQITEQEANKVDGKFIMIPSKEELDKLFRISGSEFAQKERWLELVQQAWDSKTKTLTNEKFRNGKFRLDIHGHIELLPDHETYGFSSKDLLQQHWRI